MRKLFLTAVLVAPVALGAVAYHDFPNDYDSARLVANTSLELESGKKLSISHMAVHWRPQIFEAMRSGSTKQFFDPHTWYRKFGTADVPSTVKMGGVEVAAGSYELFLKVPGDDASKYFIEFKGESSFDVPMELREFPASEDGTSHNEDHMFIGLTPRGGAGSMEFVLMLVYGNHGARISGEFVAAE